MTAGAELAGKVGRLVMYLHDKALPEKRSVGALFFIVSGINILALFRNGDTYLVPMASISGKGCPTIQVSRKYFELLVFV